MACFCVVRHCCCWYTVTSCLFLTVLGLHVPSLCSNNNRPNHPNPGERSSQYAAEASCRERYGPNADWLAFIDTDEYLVPMKSDTWSQVLDDMDARNMKILKMRSSRGRPRMELMECVLRVCMFFRLSTSYVLSHAHCLSLIESNKTNPPV